MLLKIIEQKWPLDIVVFYNTGMEFDSIYHIRDRVIPMLHALGIEYVELHPKEPFLYSMFERKVKNRDGSGYHYGYSWCGGRCRWVTRGKTEAIGLYKRSLGEETIDYVGIASDEEKRIPTNLDNGKVLPLVSFGMTEKDCLEYCYAKGFRWTETDANGDEVDLYSILDRVSCWCCANKNLKELKNIYLHLPNYWEKLKYLQSRTDRPMKRGLSVFDIEKRFENGKASAMVSVSTVQVSSEQIDSYRKRVAIEMKKMGATEQELSLLHNETIRNSIINEREPRDVAWAILQ